MSWFKAFLSLFLNAFNDTENLFSGVFSQSGLFGLLFRRFSYACPSASQTQTHPFEGFEEVVYQTRCFRASQESSGFSDAGRHPAVNAMTCYKPVNVPKRGFQDLRVDVPCGRCLGCRIDRRRAWQARLLDEAQLHERKVFVTLSYDDAHLPLHGSLVKRHAQLWQKRLRKARPNDKIRFFTVGEYGDTTRRAHYHSLVFGTDFPDMRRHSKSGDHALYVSAELDALWGLGHCWIGTVTADSCGYVASYVVKKLNGAAAEERYSTLDPLTGEIHQLEPEFAIMSRRPGIGSGWYSEFKDDVFPVDRKVIKGRQVRPPPYYFDKLKRENPELAEELKRKRKAAMRQHKADSTPERLSVREEVAEAKLKLKRGKI